MKKLLAVIAVVLLSRFSFADPSNIGTQPPSAGWSFGNVTYGQEGGSLILNSLSDRYGVSTFQTANTNGQSTQLLGTNDYVEENSVKNQLAIDGYSVAYDYNPQYTGLYASEYNQTLPTNVPLTELSFEGLAGDPTAIQNVYVLTSEYDALSSQGQASSISSLNTGLAATNSQMATNTGNINTLNTGLATTNSNLAVTNTNVSNLSNRETADVSAINNMSNPNTVLDKAVNGNTVAIANETVRATSAENVLTNGLNKTNAQVNVNTQNIGVLGAGLAQTNVQVNNNTASIGALNTGLNNETARAQGVESSMQNQINQDEKVKVMADLNLRILDTKKYTVGFFDMYDGTNQRNFAFGARLTYKLGKSYEESVLEKQKKQLDAQASELLELKAQMHNLLKAQK